MARVHSKVATTTAEKQAKQRQQKKKTTAARVVKLTELVKVGGSLKLLVSNASAIDPNQFVEFARNCHKYFTWFRGIAENSPLRPLFEQLTSLVEVLHSDLIGRGKLFPESNDVLEAAARTFKIQIPPRLICVQTVQGVQQNVIDVFKAATTEFPENGGPPRGIVNVEFICFALAQIIDDGLLFWLQVRSVLESALIKAYQTSLHTGERDLQRDTYQAQIHAELRPLQEQLAAALVQQGPQAGIRPMAVPEDESLEVVRAGRVITARMNMMVIFVAALRVYGPQYEDLFVAALLLQPRRRGIYVLTETPTLNTSIFGSSRKNILEAAQFLQGKAISSRLDRIFETTFKKTVGSIGRWMGGKLALTLSLGDRPQYSRLAEFNTRRAQEGKEPVKKTDPSFIEAQADTKKALTLHYEQMLDTAMTSDPMLLTGLILRELNIQLFPLDLKRPELALLFAHEAGILPVSLTTDTFVDLKDSRGNLVTIPLPTPRQNNTFTPPQAKLIAHIVTTVQSLILGKSRNARNSAFLLAQTLQDCNPVALGTAMAELSRYINQPKEAKDAFVKRLRADWVLAGSRPLFVPEAARVVEVEEPGNDEEIEFDTANFW